MPLQTVFEGSAGGAAAAAVADAREDADSPRGDAESVRTLASISPTTPPTPVVTGAPVRAVLTCGPWCQPTLNSAIKIIDEWLVLRGEILRVAPRAGSGDGSGRERRKQRVAGAGGGV